MSIDVNSITKATFVDVPGKDKTLVIPFGAAVWKEMRAKLNPTADKRDENNGILFGLIAGHIDACLKKEGYRSIGRGRVFFEDALDWQIRFEIDRIAGCLARKKIPKYLMFKISKAIPRVE